MKILNYRVGSENIKQICDYFLITEEVFYQINGCKNIELGQIVKIALTQTYIVQPGDDLESISANFMCTKEEVKQKFGETFFIGEKLEL